MQRIPLHLDPPSDPARRRAVVGGFDFDAAVQMHGALAVLVIAERFERQRQQERLLFGKHGRHLPFGGAVDARVGPARFPVVQIGLGLFQALEAQSFQRRFLGVADAGFDLPFAIRISDAAGQGDHAVVGEHIAIERIERGIVDVRSEHAFAQIVEHHDAHAAAQPAERFLMQFGPDCVNWNGRPAGEPTCGCSPASSRTAACAGTCRSADRAPSDRCRNRPGLLRQGVSDDDRPRLRRS